MTTQTNSTQAQMQNRNKNVRFAYFLTTAKRTLTLARELRDGENGMKVMEVGFALQNPIDQHDKTLARTIASGRLRKHPVTVDVTEVVNSDEEAIGRTLSMMAAQAVLNHARTNGRLVYVEDALEEALDSDEL